MSNSGSGGAHHLHHEFTSLSRATWNELADLADESAVSAEASTRLRLAVLELAPGWWVRLRQAEQAERARPTGRTGDPDQPDE